MYEDIFQTLSSDQRVVEVEVFQGESLQLSRNLSIGRFTIEGLNQAKDSDGEILVRFDLTLDGTLTVTAVERKSGVKKILKIDNALSQMGNEGKKSTEERLEFLFRDSDGFTSTVEASVSEDDDQNGRPDEWLQTSDARVNLRIDESGGSDPKPNEVIQRAKSVRGSVSGDDAEDIDRLIGLIENAKQQEDGEMLEGLEAELEDLLFYLT